MALAKVAAGDLIKATDHNLMVDEINTKVTGDQVDAKISTATTAINSSVDTKISTATTAINSSVDTKVASAVSSLVNDAPETLDTLAEIAAALTKNTEVVDTLNAAIGNKADKTAVATLTTDVTTLKGQMATSDKHKSVAWDPTTKSLVITYKDGTTAKVAIPVQTTAVYS